MSWQDALDAFEASVRAVEVALASGDWADWVEQGPAGAVGEPPTAQDRERFGDLQGRADRAISQLGLAMAQTVEDLRGIERRRAATRGYLMSQVSRMPEPSCSA